MGFQAASPELVGDVVAEDHSQPLDELCFGRAAEVHKAAVRFADRLLEEIRRAEVRSQGGAHCLLGEPAQAALDNTRQ